jgi:hypothetical protein
LAAAATAPTSAVGMSAVLNIVLLPQLILALLLRPLSSAPFPCCSLSLPCRAAADCCAKQRPCCVR